MNDVSTITSKVRFGDKWFYVSTIDRDSSAILGPRRFAETIVWEFDPITNKTGEMIWEGSGLEGSIFTHLQVCQFLHEDGSPEPQEEL